MPKILTVDLGTTLYKVALFDESGALLALERAAPPIRRPQPGWAVVDPGEFVETLLDAVAKLRARSGGEWSDVAAVSFATQTNSFTFIDSSGEPTMDLILWTDRRAAALAPELAQIAAMAGYHQ